MTKKKIFVSILIHNSEKHLSKLFKVIDKLRDDTSNEIFTHFLLNDCKDKSKSLISDYQDINKNVIIQEKNFNIEIPEHERHLRDIQYDRITKLKKLRELALNEFKNSNYDYYLVLDSDIIDVPDNFIDYLINTKKDFIGIPLYWPWANNLNDLRLYELGNMRNDLNIEDLKKLNPNKELIELTQANATCFVSRKCIESGLRYIDKRKDDEYQEGAVFSDYAIEKGYKIWGLLKQYMTHAFNPRKIFKNVIYYSPLFTFEGITKAAREYVSMFHNNGYRIMCTDTNWSDIYDLPRDIYNVIDVNKDYYITILNTRPHNWIYHNLRNLIGYHVLEGDLWPKSDVNGINNSNVKLLCVPSTKNKNVAIKSGVTKPIEVLPHIINERYIPKDKINDVYVGFLFSGAIFGLTKQDRKGLDVMLKAWKQFENNDNCILYLKINTTYAKKIYKQQGKTFSTKEYIKKISDIKNFKNIIIIENDLTEQEMVSLYNEVDCYIAPTRGEGFGMIGMEALACGTPVIHTVNTGAWEYLNEVNPNIEENYNGVMYIKTKGIIPAEKRYPYYEDGKQANWIEPDEKDLIKQMKWFIKNKKDFKAEAMVASKIIHEKFNRNTIMRKFEAIYNKHF